MTLSNDVLAYGQQKNREHAFYQAKRELADMKALTNDTSKWNDDDIEWVDNRYLKLCEQANITPW